MVLPVISVRAHRVKQACNDRPTSLKLLVVARNLEPAAALGMTTALVTNPEAWARDGHDGRHVHHLIDDLSAWLAEIAGIVA